MSIAWKQNKMWLSFLACAFLVICAVSLTKTYLSVDTSASSNTSTDKSGDTSTWSFAKMSQAAAEALNTAVSRSEKSILVQLGAGNSVDYTKGLRVASGLSGYADVQITNGVIQSLTATVANNAISYDVSNINEFEHITIDASQGGAVRSKNMLMHFVYYAGLGSMLQDMGFDEVCESGVVDPKRGPIGACFTAAYAMSTGVDKFWEYVIKFLEYVDPFRAFGDIAVRGNISSDLPGKELTDDNGNVIIDPDTGDAVRVPTSANTGDSIVFYLQTGLNALSRICSNIYNKLHDSALVVIIPLLLAFALFRWLVMNKGGEFGKTFKGFAIKVVYIAIGVPLCLAIYSTAVGLVSNYVLGRANASTKIVGSVFFNFDAFAKNNMAMNALTWDIGSPMYNVETWSVTSEAYNQIRTICLKSFGDTVVGTSVNDTAALLYSNTNQNGNSGFTEWDSYVARVGLSRLGSDNGHGLDSLTTVDTSAVFELIQRYTKGEVTLPSIIESRVKRDLFNGTLPGSQAGADGRKTRFNYLCHMSDAPSEFLVDDCVKHDINVSGEIVQTITPDEAKEYAQTRWDENAKLPGNNDFGANSFNWGNADHRYNGNIWGYSHLTTIFPNGTPYLVSYYNNNSSSVFPQPALVTRGLSDMGTYNYLSTKFQAGSYVVASSLNSSDDKALYSHYSVNIVGSGMIKIVFVGVALCSMLTFVVLGYLYGIGILVASVRALFKMIPAVFSGMMGVMSGIATTFVILFALIFEILGTCLLYAIASDFMYGVYNLIEGPIVTMISNALMSGENSVDAHFLIPLQGVISIVVSVGIVKNLIKYRYAVCQSLAEMSREIINKFLGTNVGDAGISSPMDSLGEIAKTAPMWAPALAVGASAAQNSSKSHGAALGLESDQSEPSGSSGSTRRPMTDAEIQKAIDDQYGDSTDNGKRFGEELDEMHAENAALRNQANAVANGRTPEEAAENYVNDNKDAFEKSLAGNSSDGNSNDAAGEASKDKDGDPNILWTMGDGNGGTMTATGVHIPEPKSDAEIEAEGGDSGKKTMSIAGNESGEIVNKDGQVGHIVNAETGAPYTQADKQAGAAYSVVDGNGNAIVSSSGQTLSNMSADTLTQQGNGIVSVAAEGGGMKFAGVPDISASGSVTSNVSATGTISGSANGIVTGAVNSNIDGNVSGNVTGTGGAGGMVGGYSMAVPSGVASAIPGLSEGQSITINPTVAAAAAGYMAGAMSYGSNPVQVVAGAAMASTVAGGAVSSVIGSVPTAAAAPAANTTIVQGVGDGGNTFVNNNTSVGDAGGYVVSAGGNNAGTGDVNVQQNVTNTAVTEAVNSESNVTNKTSNNSTNANISNNETGGSKSDNSDDSGVDGVMQGAADVTGKIFNTFGKVVNQLGQSMRDKRNPPGGK